MASGALIVSLPGNLSRDGIAFLRPIADAGVPYLFERSVKFVAGAIEADRFLVTLARDVLGERPAVTLAARFGGSAWPVAVRERVAEALVGCIAVHFGFEVDRGAIGHKVYLEYPVVASDGRGSRGETLVHRAFKWRPEVPSRVVETRYVHVPLAEGGIAAALGDERPAAEILAQLAGLAQGRAPRADLELLEVREPGHARRSFDLQVYDAGLRVSDALYAARLRASALELRPEQISDALAPVQGARLGHVAAGVDREGAPFVTLYFAPERR